MLTWISRILMEDTALITALKNKFQFTALYLIAAGADVNILGQSNSREGNSALEIASNLQLHYVIPALLAAGADIHDNKINLKLKSLCGCACIPGKCNKLSGIIACKQLISAGMKLSFDDVKSIPEKCVYYSYYDDDDNDDYNTNDCQHYEADIPEALYKLDVILSECGYRYIRNYCKKLVNNDGVRTLKSLSACIVRNVLKPNAIFAAGKLGLSLDLQELITLKQYNGRNKLLVTALQSRFQDVSICLIEKGEHINICNEIGQSPLYIALEEK